MKLSKLSNRTATCTLDIEGEPLTLTVRPYLMTPERERLMSRAETADDAVDSLMTFFCDYVVSWDVTDDNDNPVPIEPASVGALVPSNVVLYILRESKAATDPLDLTSAAKRRR